MAHTPKLAESQAKRCFICTRRVKVWRRPYVVLGTDGYGKPAFAHFVCYMNARTPLVQS